MPEVNRTDREIKRAAEGKSPAVSVPSVNEPRFISESYFLDFKFEPGNYYLAGKETLDGKPVLKIDYLPTKLFDDHDDDEDAHEDKDVSVTITVGGNAEVKQQTEEQKKEEARKEEERTKKEEERKKKQAEARSKREEQRSQKEKDYEAAIDRKMNKTSQITMWIDPATHQIVKYTFDNVWLDFLPVGWLVRIDDLRANMQMFQPFPDVWLPRAIRIAIDLSTAAGEVDGRFATDYHDYRLASVSSRIR